MTERVIIGDCELWHGDCREVIAELPIETDFGLLTDPPYGLGNKMNGGTWGAAAKYAEFREWDEAPPPGLILGLARFNPAIIWGGNYFALPPSRCWMVWDKINAVATMADLEMAWTNLDMPAKRLRLPVGKHEWGHPTEKPLRLMAWCLSFMRGCETIFDPFMGTGTTGVACVQSGLRFVGIEVRRKYFEIACERIAYAHAQGSLLPKNQPQQTQEVLW